MVDTAGSASSSAPVAHNGETDCSICFEPLVSRGGAITLPCDCKTDYCSLCWDRALAASMSACGQALCPSCRCGLQVDFNPDHGCLRFVRKPAGEHAPDDWRRRLYEQAKPRQIRLLKEYGEQKANDALAASLDSSEAAPRCVCGSRLNCSSVRERVLAFLAEENPAQHSQALIEQLMLRPPIVCDICDQPVLPQQQVWTCENGRRTVLHAVAYDVCERCFSFHVDHLAPALSERWVPMNDNEGDEDEET